MANGTATQELVIHSISADVAMEYLATEDWELARQSLVELEEFRSARDEIESRFEIDLTDIEAIVDLPTDSFNNLKNDMVLVIDSQLLRFSEMFRQKVCVDLDYCNLKKSKGWRIVEYLIGALAIVFDKGLIPLSFYIFKREILDELCQCPEREAEHIAD
ncbi:hypothetical protein [Nitrosovibrio tenuis]|uniref:Uncharacterized protein n=1 Tax=Nitrosovibrio tenuis TaxID=1233 RepID=A0A1H7KAE7_9PROT|nr:hypothetical protein [Nitrosovibrio tenuis]SEK83446.1 hypothetical protein SAMN05216387_103152 [Nitrosovibrio tenuis]